jgi:uncharacterized protein (DUF362 family)/Pyruvate/2-oxoacid:ferredoxin oxidoreductase delta subunit
MSKVAIVKCGDYEYERVKKAVRESLDLLGGISSFISPGDRVLLKVNLLIRRRPEKVTTTHPSLARALAELVLEAGAHPIIGDSPGGYHYYTPATLEAVYETCGMKEAAELSGAELNFNTEVVDVPYPEGKLMKSIKTIKPVLEADKIINIPKIKTHAMTVYSGAVKNLFGVIPGRYKPEYHLRFEDTGDFADVLIDICSFVKPVLTVMDAVVGMQGYGPTNGSPKQVGLILSSANPYELDVAAAKIIGLKPKLIPTVRRSIDRGLCSGELDTVEVVGEKPEDVSVSDFKIPTLKLSFNLYNLLLPKFISKRLNRVMKAKPCFDFETCKGCGQCARGCPPQAIEMVDGKPVMNLDKCIRCFCCHELCNYNAVEIKRPWWLRLLLR